MFIHQEFQNKSSFFIRYLIKLQIAVAEHLWSYSAYEIQEVNYSYFCTAATKSYLTFINVGNKSFIKFVYIFVFFSLCQNHNILSYEVFSMYSCTRLVRQYYIFIDAIRILTSIQCELHEKSKARDPIKLLKIFCST